MRRLFGYGTCARFRLLVRAARCIVRVLWIRSCRMVRIVQIEELAHGRARALALSAAAAEPVRHGEAEQLSSGGGPACVSR
jgi:hypothetical protein